jgi:hypothetical protein
VNNYSCQVIISKLAEVNTIPAQKWVKVGQQLPVTTTVFTGFHTQNCAYTVENPKVSNTQVPNMLFQDISEMCNPIKNSFRVLRIRTIFAMRGAVIAFVKNVSRKGWD